MNKNILIRDLPLNVRPYEKCFTFGPECLSDSELLAIIIRTGVKGYSCETIAGEILKSLPGNNLSGLLRCDEEQIKEIAGVGKVKSVQILALKEIVKRVTRNSFNTDSIIFDSPEKVVNEYMNTMRQKETEELLVLLLNANNTLIKEIWLAKGSFNSCIASSKEVFYYAIKYKAINIIISHNHPSGDPTPSENDIYVTDNFIETGKIVGISLIDHIIMGDNKYFSLKEHNLLS